MPNFRIGDQQDRNESRPGRPAYYCAGSRVDSLGPRRCSGLHALVRCFENKQVTVKSASAGFDESPRLPLHGTEGTAHRNTMLNRRSRRAKGIRTPIENRKTAFRTKNAPGFVERRVTVLDFNPDHGEYNATSGLRPGKCNTRTAPMQGN